jgi:hypothetical protein
MSADKYMEIKSYVRKPQTSACHNTNQTEKLTGPQLVNPFPHFMQPEVPVPCATRPAILSPNLSQMNPVNALIPILLVQTTVTSHKFTEISFMKSVSKQASVSQS